MKGQTSVTQPSLPASLTSRFSHGDRKLIEGAYRFAKKAHREHVRDSGEPYLTHPIAVAGTLADMGFDATTIAAALLHDVLEDSDVSRETLEQLFSRDVAALVDGVTKLSAISYRARLSRVVATDTHTASLKKMFFATAEDLRVIIIKLADRLHNMQTIKHKKSESRERIARQTMEIYAPIADRLGMGRLRGELEDLAFPYAYSAEYAWLRKKVRSRYSTRTRYIERTAPIVKRHLKNADVPILDVHARVKHMWSLYRKLKRYDMDPDKVMDLVALRIIVPDVRSCYEALGVVHAFYKPMPGRVKDYIALPKPNGYRSLHTTVFCEKGQLAEIQIRTPRMHDHAENGVAAHWNYSDSGKRSVSAKQAELAWINQLKQSLKEIKTSQGMAKVKIDFFRDRIFVLTPHGEIKDLPEGATPVDFAYAVHSELGHRVTGALANGRIIPITQPLESGDVVEIIKGKHSKPSMDWVKTTKTNHAAKKVRAWFKKNDPSIAIQDGRAILNKELSRGGLSIDKLNRQQINQLLASTSSRTLDDLLTHLSMRDFDAALVARVLLPEPKPQRKRQLGGPPVIQKAANGGSTVILAGQPGLAYRIGKCCNPGPDDTVIGYLTMARGVTVHHHGCSNLRNAEERRLMEAAWK